MVDPVTTSVGRMRPTRDAQESAAQQKATALSAPAGSSRAGSDSIQLSTQAKALPDGLKSGPPMDIEVVDRIKEAISEGKYPIDLEAITESLFQNFRELVS